MPKKSPRALVLALGLFIEPVFGDTDADRGWSLWAGPVVGYAQISASSASDEFDAEIVRYSDRQDVVVGVELIAGYDWGSWNTNIAYTYRYRTDVNVYFNGVGPYFTRNNVENQQLSLTQNRFFTPRFGITPFLGASIGIVRNSSETTYCPQSPCPLLHKNGKVHFSPTWSFNAGFQWRASESWRLAITYRYVDLGEARTGTFANRLQVTTDRIGSHEVMLAIRIL